MSRGNNRGDVFLADDDRLVFLALLAESVRRYRWIIHEFVLMTNHYHLVLEMPEMTLSRGMKWLNQKYAQWFNRRHDRVGHLFQGRFKSILVQKETHLLELLRYVALNPVRAKMVARPEEYRWSSYRAKAATKPRRSGSRRIGHSRNSVMTWRRSRMDTAGSSTTELASSAISSTTSSHNCSSVAPHGSSGCVL